MSNVLYPVALIATLKLTPSIKVIADAFEDGTSAARLMWPVGFFRRQVELTHAPLTDLEFSSLRAFFTARNGSYDPFFFRDNVTRQGNILCRIVQPTVYQKDAATYTCQVTMQEVAPLQAMPEVSDVQAAAGDGPDLWLDANRQTYVLHLGAVSTSATLWDSAGNNSILPKTPVGSYLLIGAETAQYQLFNMGYHWTSLTNESVAGGGSFQKTVFCICSNPTSGTKQVLINGGQIGAGNGYGIAISAANNYEPFIGGSEVWTGAQIANSPANTLRSIAMVINSGAATMYANGVATGPASNSFNDLAGPISTGKAVDGSLPMLSPGSPMQHVLVFSSALTLAQIKAVHNLFAYQYGLPPA